MNTSQFLGPHHWKIWRSDWNLEGPSRGTVFGVHGYSEYSGRYHHFCEFLKARGFNSTWLDLPGHGRSEGPRANIDRFEDYVTCVQKLVEGSSGLPRPWILFAHSLGGLVSTRYLQTTANSAGFSSFVLSSPLFGIKMFPPCSYPALRIFFSLIPNLTIRNPAYTDNESDPTSAGLTHDVAIARDRGSDKLVNGLVTSHWLREFARARSEALRDLGKLKLPVGIFQAGDERIVRREETEKVFAALQSPKKIYKVYEGFFHEILNEIGREMPMNDMAKWMDECIS